MSLTILSKRISHAGAHLRRINSWREAEVKPVYEYHEYCVCPHCRYTVTQQNQELVCSNCNNRYSIEDSIPNLLPKNASEIQISYRKNYESMAEEYLTTHWYDRDHISYRHNEFANFIGKIGKNKKVLDIGSGDGQCLRDIGGGFKVAFDISRNFLKSIDLEASGMVAIQGDAEALPFLPGFFDVIIVSDIMEHVLSPEKVVTTLFNICHDDTRVFVHIPWEENLEPYLSMPYEFAHLRSFNAYSHYKLWSIFSTLKSKYSFPNLREPIIFRLEHKIPSIIFRSLVDVYFTNQKLALKEVKWREKKMSEFPKQQWLLKLFFKPIFRNFELRKKNVDKVSKTTRIIQIILNLFQ